jgi:hypothetical protein
MLSVLLAVLGSVCVTPCGMVARDVVCADLVQAEQRALNAFEKHLAWPRQDSCKALRGWTVKVHKRTKLDDLFHLGPDFYGMCARTGWWSEEARICVRGYTFVKERVMEVMPEFLPQTALAHEMIHALDYMQSRKLGHCHWVKQRAALFEATSIPDDSESCP